MNHLFISMEGPDGSGKSTQAALLCDYLKELGYEVLVTREPGGTRISEQIRDVILDCDNVKMSDMTELLLYTAARAQLVDEQIRPALQQGKVVICDRFIDSSAVYQGMARGMGTEFVYEMNRHALQGLMPDLTLFLDLSAEEGIRRKNDQKELDRMEMQNLEFHNKVAEGYRTLAATYPDRIRQFDATLPVKELSQQLIQCVSTYLTEERTQ